MSLNELTETSLPDLARGRACVVVATTETDENLRRCLESVLTHTPPEVPVVAVAAAPDLRAGLRALLEEQGDGRQSIWLSPAEIDLKRGEAGRRRARISARQAEPTPHGGRQPRAGAPVAS